MAMSFQSHKTLHNWPTTKLQAQKYQSQKPQSPYHPLSNSVQEFSLQESHTRQVSASSCYSVPETLPKSNLKIEAASQLRSFSSGSGRILRPPLQLHQRPFLPSENIRPARPTPVRRSQSDPDRDCSLETPLVPPKDDVMTPPQQGHNLCVSSESDTEPNKRNTFGYTELPSTDSSYWSDPSSSESGSSSEDEEEFTDAEGTDFETSAIEDSLLHSSIIQAQRVSFHTWILNPTTDDDAPNPRPKLNWRRQIGYRNIAGPHHSKEAKRWGIIF
ncbi:hypothetical protein FNYG_01037 [Fusarium nygamai]|uniref:Uncharacterized protein n=1 Tax=Gibberella nygamai TaxID=42673 RepID=A0A2K0WUN2_GIBNY|nr:hypothetical protein FNYG_01037 [Fusarium nygamai]